MLPGPAAARLVSYAGDSMIWGRLERWACLESDSAKHRADSPLLADAIRQGLGCRAAGKVEVLEVILISLGNGPGKSRASEMEP